MATKDNIKELWVGWTRDAMGKYVLPDKVDDAEEMVDDMIEVATSYADGMLDEFEERFSGGRGSRRRRRPEEPEGSEDPEEEED